MAVAANVSTVLNLPSMNQNKQQKVREKNAY